MSPLFAQGLDDLEACGNLRAVLDGGEEDGEGTDIFD